jgi:hypothetical protein
MNGRPDESEFPPYAKPYVECVEGEDVFAALSRQLSQFHAIFTPLDLSVAATYRYAPGKWSINEVVGHITDTERIFAYRLLRIARNDATPLPAFEQNDYVAAGDFNRRTLADLLSEFESVRHSSMRLVRGLPGEAWMRRGTASGFSVTARGVAFLVAGHESYHSRILRERYLKVTQIK